MAADYITIPIVPRIQGEIAAHVVVTVFVLLVVGLRILGRVRGIGLGWDDYLVILATLMAVTLLAMEGVWASIGEGHDLLPTEPYFEQLLFNTPQILKMLIGFTLVYLKALAMVKCSLLAFYLRVFPTPRMQLLIKFSIAMTVVWVVAHELALIFLCKPVRYQWDRAIPADQNPTCGDQLALYTSVVVTNIFSDFWIMALPMYTIWNLKMRSAEKAALTLCFLLGLGTVALSCARLANLYKIAVSTNLTGTMDIAVLLGILEIDFGILAVSIPLLRPFYKRYKQKMSSSLLEEGTGNRYASKNPSRKMAPTRPYAPGSQNADTWQMGDYSSGNANKGSKPSSDENSGDDDDRGSERRLTSSLPASRIKVQTDWTVSRG